VSEHEIPASTTSKTC